MKSSDPITVGTARSIFGAEALDARQTTFELHLRSLPAILRTYYSDGSAWAALLFCTLLVGYGGGAVMFWFHSIYLNEGGPGISPYLHWFIDSSAGFVGLAPVVAVIVPLAAMVAGRIGWSPGTPVPAVPFALVGGSALAVATAPAPLLHDGLIGRGTWFAARMTEWWGGHHDHPLGRPHEVSNVLAMVQQIAAGIPIYVTVFLIAIVAGRVFARAVAFLDGAWS
jgi:hypothetical protein